MSLSVRVKFTILGAPRTKKNHQQIRRTRAGVPFIAQADTASAWEQGAILQLRARWHAGPLDAPQNLRAHVFRDRDTGDLGNYLAAICDALERSGVLSNDKLIRGFDHSRLYVDRARPRVEIELTPLVEADVVWSAN